MESEQSNSANVNSPFVLNDFCFLCLGHYVNLNSITTPGSDGVLLQDKLRSFLPEYEFLEAEIPKYVCTTCFDNLTNIYKFKQKCLNSMATLNDYIQKLILRDGSCDYLSLKLTNILAYKESKMLNDETIIVNTETKNEAEMFEEIIIKQEPIVSFEEETLGNKNDIAPKTSAQRVQEYRERKNPPKTGAQRNKEFRDRQKALEAAWILQNKTIDSTDKTKLTFREKEILRKREYRARLKAFKQQKQPPKTEAERAREYRARKKALKTAEDEENCIADKVECVLTEDKQMIEEVTIKKESLSEEEEIQEPFLSENIEIKHEPEANFCDDYSSIENEEIDDPLAENNFDNEQGERENEVITPPNINKSAIYLPEKSKIKYDKQYDLFRKWCCLVNAKDYSEKVLLAYFSEKSKVMKSSTLWSVYSMLKATLLLKNGVDIKDYMELLDFLKRQSIGYRPNTKILSRKEMNKFILEAPDDEYLMMKVVLIIGVSGACRRDELVQICVEDIEDKGSVLFVKIAGSKTNAERTFKITDNKTLGLLALFRKYAALRPPHNKSKRFFLKYINGRCLAQVVGMNTIGKIPTYIAEFLNLPDPKSFTGHCFRRSAAELMAEGRTHQL